MTIFKTLNGEWRNEEQGTGNASGISSGNASVSAVGIARRKQLFFLLSFGGVCWIKERRLSSDYIKSYSLWFHKIVIILFINGNNLENRKHVKRDWLCIKPGIQERGTEWGECYIPGNVAKHSGEFPQTFRGMLPNVPAESVLKDSRECLCYSRGWGRRNSPRFLGICKYLIK